jgi:hypothetical protein
VRATAPLYRLSAARADNIIAEVAAAVSQWQRVARDADVSRDEIASLAAAFDVSASL